MRRQSFINLQNQSIDERGEEEEEEDSRSFFADWMIDSGDSGDWDYSSAGRRYPLLILYIN